MKAGLFMTSGLLIGGIGYILAKKTWPGPTAFVLQGLIPIALLGASILLLFKAAVEFIACRRAARNRSP